MISYSFIFTGSHSFLHEAHFCFSALKLLLLRIVLTILFKKCFRKYTNSLLALIGWLVFAKY